jgi:hypothetical protein
MARATLDILSTRVEGKLEPIETPTDLIARWDKLSIQLEKVSNTLAKGQSLGLVSHSVMYQIGTAPENSAVPIYDPKTTWIGFNEKSIYPDNA